MSTGAETFNLKQFFDELSDASDDLAALGQLARQIAARREQLLQALRTGAISEAREIVRAWCQDNPAAVGMINYVMTSDVNSAINAIGMYDAAMADSLRNVTGNFALLQQSWNGPAS